MGAVGVVSVTDPNPANVSPDPDCRVVQVVLRVKRGVPTAYAWEPVIYPRRQEPHQRIPGGGTGQERQANHAQDFIVEPITLRKGLVGAKPERVCRWILDLLNVQPGRHRGRPVSRHGHHGTSRRGSHGAAAQERVRVNVHHAVLQFPSRRTRELSREKIHAEISLIYSPQVR